MEVKIGVSQVNRELVIDTELDAAGVEDAVRTAVTDGGALSLQDTKGRRIIVPVEKLAYIEITTSTAGQVGFKV